jgi:hypothetical protein
MARWAEDLTLDLAPAWNLVWMFFVVRWGGALGSRGMVGHVLTLF